MINFVKMHGLGNDYIFVDCFLHGKIRRPNTLAKKLSDRHFGVGGDGLVLILPSKIADAKMRMYNADGSEGLMCGNAIRCVGKYLYENRTPHPNHDGNPPNLPRQISVETRAGVKKLFLYTSRGRVVRVRVDMGKKIGNPHAVNFVPDPDAVDIVAQSAPFGDTNVEFAQIIGHNHIKMRVHERGSGETMACGTGACAVALDAVSRGLCDHDRDITVSMRGGDLCVRVTDETIYMTGDCTEIFRGVYNENQR